MRRALLLALVLAVACTKRDNTLPTGRLDPKAYLGLEDDASWVYRDDGSRDEPVPEQLLQARYQGDGRVEFRRGSRWADAENVGWIEWGTEGGISLNAWSLFDYEGDEPVQLANTSEGIGDSISSDGWSCALDIPVTVETFYATYDDPLELICEGDAGIPGDYYFAKDFGLVYFENDDLTLDIVAPW